MSNFKESNYYKHAKRELEILGYDMDDSSDDMNNMMRDCLLELLEVFGNQGHSGFSANYCISAFSKLAMFEPLALKESE